MEEKLINPEDVQEPKSKDLLALYSPTELSKIETCWERLIIDEKALIKLCTYGLTQKEITIFFGCSTSCLNDYLKNKYRCTLSDVMSHYGAMKKARLRMLQHQKAEDGDTKMLIHLGKYELDQNDMALRKDPDSEEKEKMKLLTEEELIKLAKGEIGGSDKTEDTRKNAKETEARQDEEHR